jgi:LemA protein
MSKNTIVLLAVVGILAVVGFGTCSSYNKLVDLNQDVERAWSDVQSQYQRRADLIPNLVATVEGAASFEKETLQGVIEARANATRPQINAENVLNDPQAFQQFLQAQDNLGAALGRLLVVVERYPDLKANQNFRDLQTQLEGTENRIGVERRRFNETVQRYNGAVKKFPAVLLAGMFGFGEKQYFAATQEAQQAPKVNFSGDK